MGTRLKLLAFVALAGLLLAGAVAQCSRQYARMTPTPTKTPRPTFTATPLPTNTTLPSPTPLPTDTPAPPLAPTAEPTTVVPPTATVVSPTAVPPPSATPLPPPPTATRRPPATATKKPTPAPTKTPPPPFTGKIVKGYARCDGFAVVTGFVKHANNSAYPDVAVGVWSDTWDGEVRRTEASGKFDVVLSGQGPGKFNVAVVELGTCSQQDGRAVARNCKLKSNVLVASVSQACSGAGANQVTEVSFTGP